MHVREIRDDSFVETNFLNGLGDGLIFQPNTFQHLRGALLARARRTATSPRPLPGPPPAPAPPPARPGPARPSFLSGSALGPQPRAESLSAPELPRACTRAPTGRRRIPELSRTRVPAGGRPAPSRLKLGEDSGERLSFRSSYFETESVAAASARMASSEEQGGAPCGFIRQNSSNSVSLDFEPHTEYQFVEQLEERYKCAFCHSVLHNPHQTGCGHRFCQHCILSLRELNAVPICPVDKEVIKSQEVFKDNCCKREVLNLYVYCKNAPGCNAKIILGRYQDHLQQCLLQAVQCSNKNCREAVLRKDLKEHLSAYCQFREEKCLYCKKDVVVINLQNHEENLCPEYPVSCPNKCLQIIPRTKVNEHLAVCPEAEQDCPFKHYGCTVKDKRGNLQEHEHSALRDHMLLVLEKNFQLEEQISDLYKSLEQKESKIQKLAETVKKFEKEFKQFSQLFGKNGSFLSNIQVLASHIDKSAWLEAQVRQLLQMVNQQQNKYDLRPLVEAIDTVKQKITLLETNDQRLVVLEGETNKHDAHINIHKAQLNKNEERFKLLEGACYNGKLIWKVTDYKMKKREAMDGHIVSIFSQPFYTSRCGYRLCARAYLNGDGSGKGTHLSLYFVVMRGEFDSLLQWPFKQRVTLMLLDQSGKKNHIMETFKADPNSSSFKRPDGEMNIASGCPRFVAHSTLENAKNTYIKDDTLFLKVAVDLTDLEDL